VPGFQIDRRCGGLRELRRRSGRYLLETMCVGGGQGVAAVFEAA
jgi:acetyl-CoA C-acetyltransferase